MSAGRSTDRGVGGSNNDSTHCKRSSSPQLARAGAYPYPREPPTSYLPVSPFGAPCAGTKVGNDLHSLPLSQELLRKRPTMLHEYHLSAAVRDSYSDTNSLASHDDALSSGSQASAMKKIKLEPPLPPTSSRHQHQIHGLHPHQQQLPHQQQHHPLQQLQSHHLPHLQPGSTAREQPVGAAREQSAVPSWARPLTIDIASSSVAASNGAAAAGGSAAADKEGKEEPGYHPKIEAISPTLPSSSEDTKAELVQSIGRMDREIGKVENQIAQLKKKQQQLEDEASMPDTKVKEESPDSMSLQSRPLSVAQVVYTENRGKAQRAHNMLSGLGPKVDLPLYNLPSDAPACIAVCERFIKFKSKLIDMFKARHVEQQQQEKYMIERYSDLMQNWVKKLEAKTAKKKVKEQKNREYFERIFPELKKQRDDKDRFQSRVGSRSVLGYARTEAELEQIMDSLHEQEEEEKKMKAYAVIPPILPESRNVRTYRFINNNSRVEDSMAEHKEMLQCLNMWSDQEKEIFREKYLQHPKNFVFIASCLPKKTVAECVRYYYLTKNAEKYKSLLKKQRAVNTKKRLPPKQQLRGFIKTEKDSGKNDDDEEADDHPPVDAVSAAVHLASEARAAIGNEMQCQGQVTVGELQQRDRRDEPSSESQCCCVACGASLGSAPSHQHAVNRANCEAYGIKEADLNPDMRVCSTCWRNSVRRRYLQCPISSCRTPKRRVKRLRQLPLKWADLPVELKDSLMKELGVKDTVSRCCAACFARISKHMGNNPRTNEPFLPLTPEDCLPATCGTAAGDACAGALPVIACRWTDEEVDVVKQSLRANGKNWTAMAASLGSKTEHQCRFFYSKYKKIHHFDDAVKEFRRSKGNHDRDTGPDSSSMSEDEDNGEDNGESTDSCELPGVAGDLPAADGVSACAKVAPKPATAAGEEYDSSATASADESGCDGVPGASAALPESSALLTKADAFQSSAGGIYNSNENFGRDDAFSQHLPPQLLVRESGILNLKDVKPLKSVGDLVHRNIEETLMDRSSCSPAYNNAGAADLSTVTASGQLQRSSIGSGVPTEQLVDIKPSPALLMHDQQQLAPQVFHPFACGTTRLYMGDPRDYKTTVESSNRAPPPAHSHHVAAAANTGSIQNRSPVQQQAQNLVARGEVKSSPSPRLVESSAISPGLSSYNERQLARSPGCRIPPPPPLIQTKPQSGYSQPPQLPSGAAASIKKDFQSQPSHLSVQSPAVAGGSITQGTPLASAGAAALPMSSSHASPVARYDHGSISQGTPRSHEHHTGSKSRSPPLLSHHHLQRSHLDVPLGMPPSSSPALSGPSGSMPGTTSTASSDANANLRAAAALLTQRTPYAMARQLIEGAGANMTNPAMLSSSPFRAGVQGLNILDPSLYLTGMQFPSAAAHFPADAASQFTKATLQNDFFTAQQMKGGTADKDGKASPSPKEPTSSVPRGYPVPPHYDPMALAAAMNPAFLSWMTSTFMADSARLMGPGGASALPMTLPPRDQQQALAMPQWLAVQAGLAGAGLDSSGLWPAGRHMGAPGMGGTVSHQSSASPARLSTSPLDGHSMTSHASRTPTSQMAQQYRRSAESPSLAANATSYQSSRHPVIQGASREHPLGRDSPSGSVYTKHDHRSLSDREPVDFVKARRTASTNSSSSASGGGVMSERSRGLDSDTKPGTTSGGDVDQPCSSRDDRLTILEQDRRTLAGNQMSLSTDQDSTPKNDVPFSKPTHNHSSRNGPLHQHTEFASNRLAELSREMPHGALHKDASLLFSSSFEKDRNLQATSDRPGETMTAASLIDVIITKHINSERPSSRASDSPPPSATSVIVIPLNKKSKRTMLSAADDPPIGSGMQEPAASPSTQTSSEWHTSSLSNVQQQQQQQPASRVLTLADHINDIIIRDYGRKAETPTSRPSEVPSGQQQLRVGGIMTGSPVYSAGRLSQTAPQRASAPGVSLQLMDSRCSSMSPRSASASADAVLGMISAETTGRQQSSPASSVTHAAPKVTSQSATMESRYDLEPISDDSNGESQEGPPSISVTQGKHLHQAFNKSSFSKQGLATSSSYRSSDSLSKGSDATKAHAFSHGSEHDVYASSALESSTRRGVEHLEPGASLATARYLSGYASRLEPAATTDSYFSPVTTSVVVPPKGLESQSKHMSSSSSSYSGSRMGDSLNSASASKQSSLYRGSGGSSLTRSASTTVLSADVSPGGPQQAATGASTLRESPGASPGSSLRDPTHHHHSQPDRSTPTAYQQQLSRQPSLSSLPTWATSSGGPSRNASGRLPVSSSSSPPPLQTSGYASGKSSQSLQSQQQLMGSTHSPPGGFFGNLMSIAAPGGGASVTSENSGIAAASRTLPPMDSHAAAMRGRDSAPPPFHSRSGKSDGQARQGRSAAPGSESPQPAANSGHGPSVDGGAFGSRFGGSLVTSEVAHRAAGTPSPQPQPSALYHGGGHGGSSSSLPLRQSYKSDSMKTSISSAGNSSVGSGGGAGASGPGSEFAAVSNNR